MQVLEVAPVFIVVNLVVDLGVNFSDTKCSRTEFDSLRCPRAASLSDIVEVLSADFEVLDPEAVSVLPSVLDLVIAKPGLAVE